MYPMIPIPKGENFKISKKTPIFNHRFGFYSTQYVGGFITNPTPQPLVAGVEVKLGVVNRLYPLSFFDDYYIVMCRD